MKKIALIGRPNVGKSTLFNRLVGKKMALVDNQPGVTRDWRSAETILHDLPVQIIDTAGLENIYDDSIESRMREQSEKAIALADILIFMIDARAGVTPVDQYFAAYLRKQEKPIIVLANKYEGRSGDGGLMDAYALGFDEPIAFSAEHGEGMAELYVRLKNLLQDDAATAIDDANIKHDFDDDIEDIEGDVEDEPKSLKIAILGRPNVGKSTLVNALIGEQRMMTGPEAGITRDSIAIDWEYNGQAIRLVDTAGIRKKARISEDLEKMMVNESFRAVRLAHVVILVLDGNAILDRQDLALADHVLNEGRVLIIAVNKWDAVEDKEKALGRLNDKLQTSLHQVKDVRTVTMSALHKKGLDVLMRSVTECYKHWNKRVSTGRMNRWLDGMTQAHPPPLVSGRPNKIKYITQIKARPPSFALFVGRPDSLPESYVRYLKNGLCETFDLHYVPVRIVLRKSDNPFAQSSK